MKVTNSKQAPYKKNQCILNIVINREVLLQLYKHVTKYGTNKNSYVTIYRKTCYY
jgi:hypothetical protein